jgi:outer membrane protein TolC
LVTPIALAISCRAIGRGGTGEMVVPEQNLREVRSVDPAELSHPTTHPVSTQPSTRATTEPLKDVPLTLSEVRELALRNNLDLKVDTVTPAIARESLNEEEARYEAVFNLDASYASNDSATSNITEANLQGTESTSWRVTPGVTVPLRTGGSIDFDVPQSYVKNNSPTSILNPAYTADFSATLRQPLLRGGGIDVNAQPIRVAFYGYQQAQARTKLEVIRVLAEADRVYWRLYAAREDLRVRRQDYDLAVAQLERARRQVGAGLVAEVEIVRAQSGVADRVEAIIIAENTQRDRERDLKRILNAPQFDMQSATAIIPITVPRPIYYDLDVPRLIAQSMQQRMELLDTELQIALETANVRVARHETLPLVSMTYTYNGNGLGDSWENSFTNLRHGETADHSAGLLVQIPIGNEAARSRLRQAMLNRIQQLATLEQRRLQIRQEVLNAADQLEANWQRILAAHQRVLLAQRLLEVEIRQFEQGLRTSTEVLNAQTQLGSAQTSEVSAISDYQIAQIDIAFATGTVLGASNILWQPTSSPNP